MDKNKIANDLQLMFWEPAIDYASSVEPITFETDAELPAQQEKWNKVQKAYSRGAKDAIDFITANYKLEEILPVNPETPEEKESRIMSEGEFNDMCARATLFPGKSIEEVKVIQLQKRIESTYEFINELLLNTIPMNTPETRKYVADLIQRRVNFNVIVRCNEENNPPDAIDGNVLIAELMWNRPYDVSTPQLRKSTLIFGDKKAVEKYQFEWMLDNENLKFIEKGI